MDITELTADMSKRAHIDETQRRRREDVLDWNDYFMATAFLSAKRSKDPTLQVGACIVNEDRRIVATGYNGFARGCSDKKYPWGKNASSPLDNKSYYVCHAEMNAILNKNLANLKGCTMYVVLFPCSECAKMIIQSGITTVYYFSDKKAHKPKYQASKKMFESADVDVIHYKPTVDKVVINFKLDNEADNDSE